MLLSRGSQGNEVRDLQGLLNYHLRAPRIPLAVDGIFGPLTDARVREFQRVNRLKPDGIVGPLTRSKLYATRTIRLNAEVSLAERRPRLVASAARFGGGILLASAGDTIPVADTPPAPQHLHIDNVQVQAGGQRTFSPWIGPGSPAFNSLVLTAQATFLVVSDGPHLELTPGAQVSLNDSPSDNKFNAQAFFQVTAADVIAPGRFHLFSPFAQATFQANFAPFSAPAVGLTVGNTFQFDIIKDNLMFFVQGSLAANLSLGNGTVNVSPQVLGGMSWQFNL